MLLVFSFTDIRPDYCRAERASDAFVHILGLALAVVAVPVLIILTLVYRSEPAAVTGVAIYSVTLIMMLTLSAVYNMVESDRWSDILRRLDHSGIYIKIAGTYTPFLLLSGVQVTTFLIGIWLSAFLGSFLKILDPERFRWFGLVLYLAMGWAAVWLGSVILVELPLSLLILMISGGIVYTVGVAFFLFERLRFHNTIWHVFVLVGSMLFFAAVAYRIALTAIR